jgi:hypothetical protein
MVWEPSLEVVVVATATSGPATAPIPLRPDGSELHAPSRSNVAPAAKAAANRRLIVPGLKRSPASSGQYRVSACLSKL